MNRQKKWICRVFVDGNQYDLSEEISLDKNIKHNIDIIVDRLIVRDGIQTRLADSIETVLKLSEGIVVVRTEDGQFLPSAKLACPDVMLA